MSKNNKLVRFYATTWCHDCARSKSFLDNKKIPYEYINIDEVPDAAEKVVEINNGMRSIPTIVFPNGDVLVEPSDDKLNEAIDRMSNENVLS